MSHTVITGWTDTDKVPGTVAETKFGQGRVSAGSAAIKCLITGNKIAAGSMTADADVELVASEDDADTLLGAGSEAARQAYAALAADGALVYAAPVAEAAGAAAGTLTLTIGGTWTGTGSMILYLGQEAYEFSVADGALLSPAAENATATNCVNKIGEDAHAFVTAAAPAAVVTCTTKSKGIRMKEYYAKIDTSNAPSGMTAVLAGGGAVGNLVPFTTGSGADTAANVIALLTTEEYGRIAAAQNDATNAARWEAHVNSEAGPLIMHREQVVFALNGAWAGALSVAQTTLNAYRCQLIWSQYDRTNPSEIAAYFAAYRSTVEGSNPNTNFDDTVIPVSSGHEQVDVPLHSELVTALNNGVTPMTTKNGDGVIVRSICSHSLNGSVADYRCLDTAHVTVPDRITADLVTLGDAARAANPYAGPDPDADDPPAPAGFMTPSLWNSQVEDELLRDQAKNWCTQVAENRPTSEWDATTKRIISAVPVVVTDQFHQLGISVRQTAV